MSSVAGAGITTLDRAGATVPPGRAAAPGATFVLPGVLSGAAPPGGAPAGVGAAGPVQAAGMLALQEWQSDSVRDREARRRGNDLLAALARLQRALLEGGTAEALARLSALLEGMPEAADPGLAAVLRAVTLRARIEIARHSNGFAAYPPRHSDDGDVLRPWRPCHAPL